MDVKLRKSYIFVGGGVIFVICLLVFIIGRRDLLSNLIHRGYYVYVLPETYADQQGWQRQIRIHSYTYHCHGSNSDRWNPINITYMNRDTGEFVFNIEISPQTALWDFSQEMNPLTVSSLWIPSQQGQYYEFTQGGINLKTTDSFGMDVLFSTNNDLSFIQNIISLIEYRGPAINSVTNPWETICK
jgi:hypothetical protein